MFWKTGKSILLSKAITVLGLGNLLCEDDAFGVHAAERLYSQYDFSPNIEIIDGGSQGPTLCPFVEESSNLLVFDAVDFDLEPYALKVFANAEAPLWLGMNKLSAHQNNFAETLALAFLRNHLPEEICLIGLQTTNNAFGKELTEKAREMVPQAVEKALDILLMWGVRAIPRPSQRHLVNNEMRKKIYAPGEHAG